MGAFKIAGLLPTDKFGKTANWTSRGSSAQIREDCEVFQRSVDQWRGGHRAQKPVSCIKDNIFSIITVNPVR
jgi:hypothetical protein